MELEEIIKEALREDIGDGDHTTLATVPADAVRSAQMYAKETGIICGVEVAKEVFLTVDPTLRVEVFLSDGAVVSQGTSIMRASGSARSILTAERTALNFIQRMSGVATKTHQLAQKIKGCGAQLLDTRKTTPLLRRLEKYAVQCGGGQNHRTGLYDMILIKDNHIDFAGGIEAALSAVEGYLQEQGKQSPVEIEVRSFDELRQVLATGKANRIMLDNFTPEQIREALKMINGRFETEASGGITEANIMEYAVTGVDFISVGALTHHIKSLDISLIAD
ncbi:MAG: carboxylating nicotinate-nucleotide diphosphorylase [Bacteroidales bacterium]|jgi:nicotinate-nucleotide pyrophosphorylase (carboxylating)|nr:carboxylating nicotinate-nucleotide diphosphorylase [Bacteroidales bacterium]